MMGEPMSKPKLLVVGLDAVETPLLLQLMEEGRLPVLSGLSDRGLSAPVEASCMSTLPGAIWQDILTGRSAWRHGDYYPSRVHTGDDRVADIDSEVHAGTYYFDHAAAEGLRCIAVDQPLVPAYTPPSELTLVSEWHVHDAIWDRGTYPTALLAELEDRFGARPYDRCDTNHTDSDASLRSFASMLERELSIKIDMVEHLMTTRPWDLCAVGISQGHCAGHQLWHTHDAARSGDRDSGASNGDLVAGVYEAIDAAIGRLIDTAGPDTGVVVFTSHGMENYVGGPQFLPTLLEAWGFHRAGTGRTALRRLAPRALLGRIFRAAPWLMKAAADAGAWTDRLTTHTRAIAVPNNRVGAIRLNLAGREPQGVVTDRDAELTELEARLSRLRHAESGDTIVERTIRTSDEFGSEAHADLPDLLVVFRRDLGELTDIRCPAAGLLHMPIRRPQYQRTGDHTDQSHLWVDHPGVADIGSLRSEDIAPSLLDLMGAQCPADLDGRNAFTSTSPSRR